jgi:hypothetical protein
MEEPLTEAGRSRGATRGVKATMRGAVTVPWRVLRFTVACAIASAGACASSASPPTVEESLAAPPPSLTGSTVMVLPAQHGPGGGLSDEPVPGLDAEISFWLSERARRVSWVFPEALERILARSPSLDIDIHALAVSAFHRAEVRNIGDPLFGNLNALGALTSARAALVPVAAAWSADSTGTGRVRVNLALIDNRTGRVIWFGLARGEPGPEGSREVAATAAESIAALFAR